jgi:hypothetical protein
MRRKWVGLLIFAWAAAGGMSPAWGSMLSLESQTTYGISPFTGLTPNITTVGNLDWVVVDNGEKVNSAVIATQDGDGSGYGNSALFETGPYNDWSAGNGYPTFFWTDSFNNAYQKPESGAPGNAGFQAGNPFVDDGSRLGTHIALPAGSGQLTVWWCWGINTGETPQFTTTFDDSTSLTVVGGPDARVSVVNYSTDTAQTLTFGMNRAAGIFAMAVSHEVPEPGTLVLLASSMIGMMIFAWRKRK